MRRLWADRRASAALETAIVLPVVVTISVLLISSYDALVSHRAVEYGLERALRHAAVRSGSATSASIIAAYRSAASSLSSDVGTNSSVTVTPTSGYQPGGTVQVAVTFTWTPTAGQPSFVAVPMNRTARVTLVN